MRSLKSNILFANVAQLVEHDLAKVGVASSNLVIRSKKVALSHLFYMAARVVELVDTLDLKSSGFAAVRVQVPLRVQKLHIDVRLFVVLGVPLFELTIDNFTNYR